jgi:hypothetical protein
MYKQADLVVPFFSKHYSKPWCALEWETIREILLLRRKDDAVIPVHLDDTEIPGWSAVNFGIQLNGRNAGEIANLILEALALRNRGAKGGSETFMKDIGALGPTNVPPVPLPFVGRSKESTAIQELLDGASGTGAQGPIAIRGQAGEGKSAFLAHLGTSLEVRQRFSDGVLWTGFGQDSMADGRTLDEWCRLCKVDAAGQLKRDKAARLGESLQGKRILMLIDDVWDDQHLGHMLCLLHPATAMIITTRLAKVASNVAISLRTYHLRGLGGLESMELLQVLAPEVVGKYRSKCEQLVEILAGNPLGLQIAGRLLARHEDYGLGTVDRQFDALLNGSEFLDKPAPANMASFIADANSQGTAESVATLLHRSIQILDQPARQCFVFTGSNVAPKPASFSWRSAKVPCCFLDNPEQEFAKLIDLGLVERLSNGRYQMHMFWTAYATARRNEAERYEDI